MTVPGPWKKPRSAEQGARGAHVRGVHVLHERGVRADRGLDPLGRRGVGRGLLELDGALDDLLVGLDRLPAEGLGGLGGALAVLANLLAGGEGSVGHGDGFLPSMSLLATLARRLLTCIMTCVTGAVSPLIDWPEYGFHVDNRRAVQGLQVPHPDPQTVDRRD